MKPDQIKKMVKKVDSMTKEVGATRDKVDELLSDLTDLKDVCDRAYEAMTEARDALSELV